MTTRYKFLRTDLKSDKGDFKWKKGEWYKHDGKLEICESGFHCSKGIYQAFSYVQGEYLAKVEVKGKHLTQDDKEVWEQMRVVKVWKWGKIDSVLFAIYAARLVLDIFEKKYPDDKRPREAIEAAERYAKNPTKKNRNAAGDAAWAAGATGDAAWATRAARAAAWAAGATGDAAWATRAAEAAEAARAAAGAAWAAAGAAIYKKCDKWMLDHVKELKEVA